MGCCVVIYMVAIDDSAICKVGFSTDVGSRLRQLQTSNPFVLRLVKTRNGCPILEKAIHNALKKFHVRGEWFRMTPEVSVIFDDTNIVVNQDGISSRPYNFITATREAMGLRKDELAEALGVNLSTVYRLEAGYIKLSKRTAIAIEALAKSKRVQVVQ